MIRIEFDGVTNADRPLLKAISAALLQVANGEYGPLADKVTKTLGAASITETIAPEDTPDTGVDASEVFGQTEDVGGFAADNNGNVVDPQTVFADPAQVFGKVTVDASTLDAGNGAGVASSPNGVTPVTTVPAASVQAVELDKNGFPWDSRIHASSREKIKDGTWKYKRGVDKTIVAAIEAELRQVMGNAPAANLSAPPAVSPVVPAPVSPIAATPAPVAPSVPNVPAAPVATAAATIVPATAIPSPVPVVTAPTAVSNTGALATPIPVPNIAPVAAIPAAPAVPGQTAPLSFATLIPKVTAAIRDNTLSQETVTATLAAYGIPSLPSLVHKPELVQPIADALGIA